MNYFETNSWKESADTTVVGTILQESGCAERGCELQMWSDAVDRVHVRHQNALTHTYDGGLILTAMLDAIGPDVVEQITAWLRERHGEVEADGD